MPPVDKSTNLRYDSILGDYKGAGIHIVYDNGRSYPEYLITYSIEKNLEEKKLYPPTNHSKKITNESVNNPITKNFGSGSGSGLFASNPARCKNQLGGPSPATSNSRSLFGGPSPVTSNSKGLFGVAKNQTRKGIFGSIAPTNPFGM
mmetsp:Transcript_24127/g.21444  ORF Transcript_24127/g.21444 Transcript_24127/m.21444 type:complete len:147 (-) Transcript_24127:50-490(-)